MILEQAEYVLLSFWVTPPLTSSRVTTKLRLYFAIFFYPVPFRMLYDRPGESSFSPWQTMPDFQTKEYVYKGVKGRVLVTLLSIHLKMHLFFISAHKYTKRQIEMSHCCLIYLVSISLGYLYMQGCYSL